MITERALRRACLAGQVDEGERFPTTVLRLGWCSVYLSRRSKRMQSIPNDMPKRKGTRGRSGSSSRAYKKVLEAMGL